MVAVALSTFMTTLDGSIVNVSLPTIQHDLNTTWAAIEWVVMAYLLTLAGLLLSGGRLADVVGRRACFVTGLGIFTVGSGLCGLSHTITQLVAFRVLQAVGGALAVANGPAIITAVFPVAQRGLALGLIGSIVSLGLTAGPALGGLIAGSRLGWPWIFLVNVPVGTVAVGLGYWALQGLPRARDGERFDYFGAALLLVTLGSLSLALSLGYRHGWTSAFSLSLLLSFLAGLALFVAWELRHEHALFDLALLRNRQFASASGAAILVFVANSGVMFLLPFYLERVVELTTRDTGLVLMTVSAALSLMAPVAGAASDRIGTRIPTVTSLLAGSGALLLMTRLGTAPSVGALIGHLLLFGAAFGAFGAPNSSAMMGSVGTRQLGVASGMIALSRTIGQLMGVAVGGAVFAGATATREMVARHEDLLAAIGTADVFVRGFHAALYVAAGIAACAAVVAALRGSRRRAAPEGLTLGPPGRES